MKHHISNPAAAALLAAANQRTVDRFLRSNLGDYLEDNSWVNDPSPHATSKFQLDLSAAPPDRVSDLVKVAYLRVVKDIVLKGPGIPPKETISQQSANLKFFNDAVHLFYTHTRAELNKASPGAGEAAHERLLEFVRDNRPAETSPTAAIAEDAIRKIESHGAVLVGAPTQQQEILKRSLTPYGLHHSAASHSDKTAASQPSTAPIRASSSQPPSSAAAPPEIVGPVYGTGGANPGPKASVTGKPLPPPPRAARPSPAMRPSFPVAGSKSVQPSQPPSTAGVLRVGTIEAELGVDKSHPQPGTRLNAAATENPSPPAQPAILSSPSKTASPSAVASNETAETTASSTRSAAQVHASAPLAATSVAESKPSAIALRLNQWRDETKKTLRNGAARLKQWSKNRLKGIKTVASALYQSTATRAGQWRNRSASALRNKASSAKIWSQESWVRTQAAGSALYTAVRKELALWPSRLTQAKINTLALHQITVDEVERLRKDVTASFRSDAKNVGNWSRKALTKTQAVSSSSIDQLKKWHINGQIALHDTGQKLEQGLQSLQTVAQNVKNWSDDRLTDAQAAKSSLKDQGQIMLYAADRRLIRGLKSLDAASAPAREHIAREFELLRIYVRAERTELIQMFKDDGHTYVLRGLGGRRRVPRTSLPPSP